MAANSLSDVTTVTNQATTDYPNDTPSSCTSGGLDHAVEKPRSFIRPSTCGDQGSKKVGSLLSNFPSSAVILKQNPTFPNALSKTNCKDSPNRMLAGSTEGKDSWPNSAIVNDIKSDDIFDREDDADTQHRSTSRAVQTRLRTCSELEAEMLSEATFSSVEHKLVSTVKHSELRVVPEKSLKDVVSDLPDGDSDICNNEPSFFLAMDVEGLLASSRHSCDSIDGSECAVSTTNDKTEPTKNKKKRKIYTSAHEKPKWKNSRLPSSIKHRSGSGKTETNKGLSDSKLNCFPGDTTNNDTPCKFASSEITDIGEIPMVDSSQSLGAGQVTTTGSNMAKSSSSSSSSVVPKRGRERRVSPNAFVSVRIPSVEIRQNIETIQRGLVDYDGDLFYTLTSLDKLHLTLCVLRLDSNSEIER